MSETSVLDYHLPADTQFSLQHVTDDREVHEQAAQDLRDDDYEVRTVEDDFGGRTALLIYAKDAPDDPLAAFDSEDEFAQWIHDHFDVDDLPLVLAVFRAYRGIIEEKADAADQLDLYKQMELEAIPAIVDKVEWGQAVPDVGAELLSRFILRHPMPNTNHRTGITLLDRYLTSIDDSFAMPDTGEEGEWYQWAEAFILDSKRLLTLRRKSQVFQYAAAVGYEAVRRKEGITIDFDRSDPFGHYTREHLERTREFVDTLLEEADAVHLHERVDDGKRVFVERLRADQ